MKQQRGFTLIELLVVIAIIAILAAILFPVFAQAREKARSASCQNNVKQMTLAILQYIQDYDEYFPPAGYDTLAPARNTPDQPWGPYRNIHTSWNHLVYPYVKNTQVFKCPSAPNGQQANNANTTNEDQTGQDQYIINRRLSGAWNAPQNAIKVAAMGFPASTIMIAENTRGGSGRTESHERDGWGWADGHYNLLNGQGASTTNYNAGNRRDRSDGISIAPLRRHNDGANYGFADGHVKWLQGQNTWVVLDTTNVGGVPRNRTGSTITYFPN